MTPYQKNKACAEVLGFATETAEVSEVPNSNAIWAQLPKSSRHFQFNAIDKWAHCGMLIDKMVEDGHCISIYPDGVEIGDFTGWYMHTKEAIVNCFLQIYRPEIMNEEH